MAEFAEDLRIDRRVIVPTMTFVTAVPGHDAAHLCRGKHVNTAKRAYDFGRVATGKSLNLWGSPDHNRGSQTGQIKVTMPPTGTDLLEGLRREFTPERFTDG